MPNYAGRAEVVRVPSGESVRGLDLPPLTVARLAVSPDGKRFAGGGTRTSIFDLESMRPAREIPAANNLLTFSHDGTRLIGELNGRLRAYDAATGKLVVENPGGKKGIPGFEYVSALVADPVGGFIYAGNQLGNVFAFDADTLALRAVFEWHLGAVWGLAASADGSRLFSTGGDGCVKVWPIRDLLRGV
jgi:WD40 repeat protein